MLEDVEWGKFRLGDLFDIESTSSFNKDKLTVGDEYDYVTRTSQNQGILQSTGFVNEENLNPAGVWSLGLLQMDFFFRRKPWYAGQFVRKIIPKMELDEYSIQWMSTVLNKQRKKLLSVLVRDLDEAFKNTLVELPIKNGEINFDFMGHFIAKIEADRIKKLDAYLSATGFKDYYLTSEEQKALDDFEDGDIDWGEFKLGDLFYIESTQSFNKDRLTVGDDYDYVTRTSQNQGILQSTGFVNKENLNPGGVWSLGLLQMDFFFRQRPWYAGQFVRKVTPKIELSQYSVQWMSAVLNKQKKKLLSVLVRDVNETFKNILVELPIKNGEIDFDFIECFTSAIHKLVIKDVVEYTNQKITAHDQIV
ncbi:restriction endonuclease subunit S [Nitratifractor salsuginis]|nr:restriction endonuclease subunit S [Nitratifractor salsuginis]